MKFDNIPLYPGKWYIINLGGEDNWLELEAEPEKEGPSEVHFNPWFETGEYLTDGKYIVGFRFPLSAPTDFEHFMTPIKKRGDEKCIKFFEFIVKYLESRGFKDTYAIIDPKDFSVEELRPYWWD